MAIRPPVQQHRQSFTTHELQAIFTSPIYLRGYRPRGGKGEAVYWLPLLALFTGARPEELARLAFKDLIRDTFLENDDSCRSAYFLTIGSDTKSEREIPVHDQLVDLGFIQFVEMSRLADEEKLFPFLTPDKFGQLTSGFRRWWNVQLPPDVDRKKSFYSFRRTFRDLGYQAGLNSDILCQMLGVRGVRGETPHCFCPSIRDLVHAMDMFRIPGLNIPRPH